MIRYLIKATYTEGSHKGESYLLTKGGYVTDEDSIHWEDRSYKTEGICRKVCKHMFEENERSRRCERVDEQIRIKRGGDPKEFYIYESQSYEPYPVEAVRY